MDLYEKLTEKEIDVVREIIARIANHQKRQFKLLDLPGIEENYSAYLVGIVFYRYLSEQANLYDTEDECLRNLGYFISRDHSFAYFVKLAENGKFSLDMLSDAFASFRKSSQKAGSVLEDIFSDIFDVFLNDEKEDSEEYMSSLLDMVGKLDFKYLCSKSCLLDYFLQGLCGDLSKQYEKGEVGTSVTCLLGNLVAGCGNVPQNICDPICGFNNPASSLGERLLLLACLAKDKTGRYPYIYGQDENPKLCALTKIRLLMHGISHEKIVVECGNVLTAPGAMQNKEGLMDCIVAVPPFKLRPGLSQKEFADLRFADFKKQTATFPYEYAYISQMLYSLKDTGTCAIVLKQGLLFRGGSDQILRKYLIKDKHYLDTVIGLPANLFAGTQISPCICLFKKNKKESSVYFIDARCEYEKEPALNARVLSQKNIRKILDACFSKTEIPKFAHLADLKEIEKNDFNLNISRYVDIQAEIENVDLDKLKGKIARLSKKQEKYEKDLDNALNDIK